MNKHLLVKLQEDLRKNKFLKKKTELGRHDLYQEITANENDFKRIFVNYFNMQSLNFELSHQEYILVTKSALVKVLKKHHKLNVFKDALQNMKDKFRIYRPDFIIHKYGIIIEIDGSSHDKELKIKKDELREYAYEALGYYYLSVNLSSMYSYFLRKILNGLRNYFYSIDGVKQFIKKHSARRKKQSKLRKQFKLNSAKAYLIGTYSRKDIRQQKYPALPNETAIQWGGYRIRVKGKK